MWLGARDNEGEPFWSFQDLLIFLGMAVPCLLGGALIVTLGPLCEELAFRGFMQPLFIRSLGVGPGIALSAAGFGLLHLPQYGFTWQHGILITLAGAAFGWMRWISGSTSGSTIMHSAYNLTLFVGFFAAGSNAPRSW